MIRAVRVVVHTLGQAVVERLGRALSAAGRHPRPLRVGVDIRPFYEPLTGVGWYLHDLLHELARRDDVELVLFGDARLTDEGPTLHTELPSKARLCVFDLRGQPRSRVTRALTAAAYVLWMWLLDCDLVFGANYFLPRLMSAVARRRVVTVHDLTYKRFPQLLQKETLHSLETQMMRELARADAVICVSDSTRRDLLAFYQLDPARVFTIHSGLSYERPGANSVPQRLPPRYILFVSTIEPRKNLGLLIEAFETLRRSGEFDGALVVAGRIGWKSEEIERRLRAPGIIHLDYVQAPQLAALYQKAEVFVFPSIYEGFGFPLLEAMAHGVPAIAARSSSLPEIGGDAALYFDPQSSADLVSQLRRVLQDGDLRRELIERGKARAAGFRWEEAGEKTIEVFRSVVH